MLGCVVLFNLFSTHQNILPMPKCCSHSFAMFHIQGEGAPVEFNGIKIERGYRDFLSLGRLHEPSNGYLVNDARIVKVKFESEVSPFPTTENYFSFVLFPSFENA